LATLEANGREISSHPRLYESVDLRDGLRHTFGHTHRYHRLHLCFVYERTHRRHPSSAVNRLEGNVRGHRLDTRLRLTVVSREAVRELEATGLID
jgi:hypothetical protein